MKRLLRRMFENFYFSHSRAKWTDDPKSDLVQLGNKINQLIAGRISEVTGVTGAEEMYLIAPGDGRYTLTRVHAGKIVEGTYLKEIDQSKSLVLVPRIIEIIGNPYKITRKLEQTSELVLKVENLNPAQ